MLQVRQREAATAKRDAALKDPTLSAAEKRAAQTRHTAEWGRAVATCPDCWLRPHYCVCDTLHTAQAQTRVLLHMHHYEWCALRSAASAVTSRKRARCCLACGAPSWSVMCASLCS